MAHRRVGHIVVAYAPLAHMALILLIACTGMPDIVTAYICMNYIVMAYMVMAYP